MNCFDENKVSYLKKNLKYIEIEIFSYCNRTCWFCPNSFLSRRKNNIFMKKDIYFKIINELNSIDYRGDVAYNRYNEPTAKKDFFLDILKETRKILPHANLKTNTNGDYIDKNYLTELKNAGLNELFIQHYELKPFEFNYEKNKNQMLKKLKDLDLPFSVLKDYPEHKIEYKIHFDGMRVQLRCRNFVEDGSSRGNTIDIAVDYTRTQKCHQPYNNMYIDYNGNVMVCCALRSDIEDHKIGIMGNIKDSSLSYIFSSSNYDSWREHHKEDGPKSGVCKTCRDHVKPSYEKESYNV